MAKNKLNQQGGIHVAHSDNPLLDDSGVRFIEETFTVYQRKFGAEGDTTGFRKCFEAWLKANSLQEAI